MLYNSDYCHIRDGSSYLDDACQQMAARYSRAFLFLSLCLQMLLTSIKYSLFLNIIYVHATVRNMQTQSEFPWKCLLRMILTEKSNSTCNFSLVCLCVRHCLLARQRILPHCIQHLWSLVTKTQWKVCWWCHKQRGPQS